MNNEKLILVDIGNTNFHIWENGYIYDLKQADKLEGRVFYISVNEKKEKEFLSLNPDAVNLKEYVKFDTDYKKLGIDRIMACKTVEIGTVIDAGSAVTVDFMKKGKHLGGIIFPGIFAYKKAFATISDKLNKDFRKPDDFPISTEEALWSGSIGSIICMIEKYGIKPVYLTGGDGKYLNQFIDGIYIEDLVFKGMKQTLIENGKWRMYNEK
ncbi:type III pantothenate kinase [Lebetimonas natsushimae]|uniref:Type III pantothenate kinase n=1 Tax=Lebetimonas natsushimae TaxID=1936991 RepID=A0A292YFG4_9BACT|nr:type III pantothenate kinase [Lebetimonas natsushimae]GAX87966.1 type III pantothenate kinase [Lebetimonas natsushimae]